MELLDTLRQPVRVRQILQKGLRDIGDRSSVQSSTDLLNNAQSVSQTFQRLRIKVSSVRNISAFSDVEVEHRASVVDDGAARASRIEIYVHGNVPAKVRAGKATNVGQFISFRVTEMLSQHSLAKRSNR